MLVTVAAADSTSTVRKKYSVFIYSEAEPHALYAIYKQTRTLCVLQYVAVSLEKYNNQTFQIANFGHPVSKPCLAP